MNPECLEAQQIVSETYDGEHVDPAAIQRARQHCTECPECSVFVSRLAAIRKTPAPSAPPRVIQNAIETIRTEVVAQAALAEEAAAATARAASAAKEDASVAPRPIPPAQQPSPRRLTQATWFAWGGWATAAAVALVLVGVLAVRGISYIAGPQEKAASDTAMITQNDSSAAPLSAAPESADDAAEASRSSASARFITVGGFVYAYTGPGARLPSNATTIGVTVSALDTGSAPQQYSVSSAGGDNFVVVTETGLYGFELVARTLRGQSYGLQSRALSGFGQWPSLPEGYAEPASDDGSPSFSRATSDDSGVAIFTPNGSDPSGGFAIAPGTSSSDPAGGNPNWTWWAPLP